MAAEELYKVEVEIAGQIFTRKIKAKSNADAEQKAAVENVELQSDHTKFKGKGKAEAAG